MQYQGQWPSVSGAAGTGPGMYLDPDSGLYLPQGTALAGAGRRTGAWCLSVVLPVVTLFVGYLVWGLIAWGRGQTPALQVLGMRCWRPGPGRRASWGWMAVREVLGTTVEGVLGPVTLALSFILMLTSPQRRCLHDMVAGTVVLYDPTGALRGARTAPGAGETAEWRS